MHRQISLFVLAIIIGFGCLAGGFVNATNGTQQTGLDLGVKGGMAEKIANKAAYDTEAVTEKTFFTYIGTVIKVVLSLVGTIFLILTVMAGIKWMTARGDETKAEEAMKTVRFATIGLLIVLSAYTITYFVSKKLEVAVSPVGGTAQTN